MRNAWKLGIAAGVVVVAAGSAVVLADGPHGDWRRGPMGFGPPPGPAMLLEELDTDKDGQLTKAEIDAARAARLKQFDSDGDGRLSLAEYQVLWLDAMRPRMVRQFQEHDRDGDALVTVEEFGFRYDRMFDRLDRDGDGIVTRAELTPPPPPPPPPHRRDRDRDDDHGPDRD